ncbi:hypothetical protein YPPY15_3191, partial [Yersinia pestis PY-15]
MPVIPA